MKTGLALGLAGVVVAAIGSNASGVVIMDRGDIDPGFTENVGGKFSRGGETLFGMKFTIDRDITFGSGLSLTIDGIGSEADTELALYNFNTRELIAINDDGGTVNGNDLGLDPYLWFGDAAQPIDPFDGGTVQSGSGFVSTHELLAGTYVVFIGPYSTTWDEFDWEDTIVDNFQVGEDWACNTYYIPAPGSLVLASAGLMVAGGRRSRQRNRD